MKQVVVITLLLVIAINASAQRADTVSIGRHDLKIQNLWLGDSTYIVYSKKTATSPAERITLVKINVGTMVVNGRKVFAITQQWDSGDEVAHPAYTIHDAEDFSTLLQDT